MNITEKIKIVINNPMPSLNRQETYTLLREAVDEIYRLQDECGRWRGLAKEAIDTIDRINKHKEEEIQQLKDMNDKLRIDDE